MSRRRRYQWAVKAAKIDQANELGQQGWEPFAVLGTPVGALVFLRRYTVEPPPAPLPVERPDRW